jgi:hypothetical protein
MQKRPVALQNESDFYPWGGELPFVANDSNHYKFTGKQRDAETQLVTSELGITRIAWEGGFLLTGHPCRSPCRTRTSVIPSR